jgi:hypothetical protein
MVSKNIIFASTILTVFCLIASVLIPVGDAVLAYSLTVDGSAADWIMAAPPTVNLGHISRDSSLRGEYVWRDNPADERPEFASPDTRVDLVEFRVTADESHLYFLAQMTDIDEASGNGATQIQLAIDTDRIGGSGESALGGFSDTQTDINAEWEYLVITRFGSDNNDLTIWQNGFSASVIAGSAEISTGNDLIEASIPWSSLELDGPPEDPLRFTVAVFRSDISDDTLEISGASDALDCVTNYGDPGDTGNTLTEVTDGVINYYFDLFFDASGEVIAPLLIHEVLYDPSATLMAGEFIEIYNVTSNEIDLSSYKLGDEKTPDGTEGMGFFGVGRIAPGGFVVVANNADTFLNTYGLFPDYAISPAGHPVSETIPYTEWATGSVRLSNSGDEVLLLDGADTVIDVIAYENFSWPGLTNTSLGAAKGQSIERDPSAVDTNDMAADFTTRDNDGTPMPGRQPCEGDDEPDGDVDGKDLAAEIDGDGVGVDVFAEDFGRTDCP